MANIFKIAKDINEHPNRNNFDLSRKSNVSLKFGTLYPVFTQPVVPGDSFDIQAAYNLKLNPIIFPVQTKMRAHMHFFYVRNKNLWKNWQNWISNLPGYTNAEHPHPYLNIPDNKFKSGSIHDFLGVPTTLVGDIPDIFVQTYPLNSDNKIGSTVLYSANSSYAYNELTGDYSALVPWCNIFAQPFSSLDTDTIHDYTFHLRFPTSIINSTPFSNDSYVKLRFLHSDTSSFDNGYTNDTYVNLGTWSDITNEEYFDADVTIDESQRSAFDNWLNARGAKMAVIQFKVGAAYESIVYDTEPTIIFRGLTLNQFLDYSESGFNLYSQHLHINALPYRAYESIYNCYYRNGVVDPLIVNGVQKYNEYNTTTADGADSTDYHLFQRNYELDFLTSALPSPQQGVAPLVGMTALGNITIEDENGITTAHAEVDNDGTISKVVLTSPAASVDHARTAMNIAASGMSINDFRNTNALQRLLETNIRKGYRYLDFIAGHFGKEPEYRELDMPEFIGGFSRDVNVSTVVSNADTLGEDSGKSLGSFGGYAQLNDGSKHNIRHYCDDYGYIIGILSVVPTPCYSQLLRKDMVAPDNFLDYYFPEFSQTGMQGIPYREVAPIQSYLDSLTDPSKTLDDTFGYQRPNYDMVSAVDEVHGDFRGSLRNYVINRIFDTRPELGHDFLAINPEEVNDIFVNTNPDDDTMIGEIGFSVHAKRPVPRVVIPNLGR